MLIDIFKKYIYIEEKEKEQTFWINKKYWRKLFLL